MSQRYFEDIATDDELEPREQLPTEDKAVEFFGRDTREPAQLFAEEVIPNFR